MDSNAARTRAVRMIVCLGIVSLFADMTYEGARSILGPLLHQLGGSAAQVGFIAGAGEMLAAALRYFSGRWADRTRAYWPLTIAGYGLTIVAVPLLALAGNWPFAALLIAAERMGKALRGPSRDVILSSATGVVGHGWGFGLHAALDQTGAVLGPLLVALAVARTHGFSAALLLLAVPGVLAMLALAGARAAFPAPVQPPAPKATQELPRVFWLYSAAAGLLALGFVDFPLLAFHFQKTGVIGPASIPLLYAAAMAVNGATALGFGRWFDRSGLVVLSAGIIVSLAALPLGFLGGPAGAVAAVVCWATGLGVQDATLRAGIARVVAMNKRGAAFGTFNAIYGIAWFAGSAAMGLLYGRSLVALAVFGVLAQAAAAAIFFGLRKRLA